MADAVTSQTLVDTEKKCIFKFTNISDGSGEANVKKIDVSTLAWAKHTLTLSGAASPNFKIGEVLTTGNEVLRIDNTDSLPAMNQVKEIREPIIKATILVPPAYIGNVIQLCQSRRGSQQRLQYLGRQVVLDYELPLAEVVLDFFDQLKSVSKGYASFDYSFLRFQQNNLVRLDILVNREKVDAFSTILHRDKAHYQGRKIIERLTKLIPRQMFEVALQAVIGSKVIARGNVKPFRKNVTAKLYGGDVTRKKKLLEKQKKGKKRMKQFGAVEIPQEAFLAIMKKDIAQQGK